MKLVPNRRHAETIRLIEIGVRLGDRFRRRAAPNWREIADAFRVSRATAYRWRGAMCSARGLIADERAGRRARRSQS